MPPVSLSSASGLRPMSAFVVIGLVVITVATWVVFLSFDRAASQPLRLRKDVGLSPAYSISDAEGRSLARFVPRFDLEMSPRSMWQAHTPDLMAREISGALGGWRSPEELLERFFPDANEGVIEVRTWDLSIRQANQLAAWIAEGVGQVPLEGIWIESRPHADGRSSFFRLFWQPEVLLSQRVRKEHGTTSPTKWTRRLADGLSAALREPEPPSRDPEERARRRDEVWSAMLPRAYCRPLEGLPSERMLALRKTLKKQGVSPLQMKIAFGRDRIYPSGEHELYGSWGFADARQTEPAPREGLELLCDQLLEAELENELVLTAPVYAWLQDRTVRGQRANTYLSYQQASDTPVVQTTLDLSLQRYVRDALEELMEEHRPALAMAIVADVQTGDVLAVDSVEEYEIQPFAPIYHLFTTGSTFKVITMATALEEGAVTPDEVIDVGTGAYRVYYPDGRRSRRVIREAENAPTGRITASTALARSVNAGLTQIGLRVPDEVFHRYVTKLGYGKKPNTGLGSERAGHLTGLPWKYAYTHTSMCFGHEITTTAWQHTAALGTVMRGGVDRPLRILRGVEQGGRRWEVGLPDGERIYSEDTCRKVRDMMRLGAAEGTGDDARLAFEELVHASLGAEYPTEGFDLATKTGTAQKVGTELCVHVELGERERWRREGLPSTRARYKSLKSLPKPHRNCYTSSIFMVGRDPRTGRELMVFVVAEEPRGKQRFGAAVSGQAAASILAEAMGITRNGRVARHEVIDGFWESKLALRSESEEPWKESR